MKEIIDEFTKEEYNVIVTVPAYFSESDKEITKRAILGANLPLLRLLSEPTAAGIAYGYFHYTTEEVILVFDMGAGTTDLTLMRKSSEDSDNFYEVSLHMQYFPYFLYFLSQKKTNEISTLAKKL